jgi:hypothetical protein
MVFRHERSTIDPPHRADPAGRGRRRRHRFGHRPRRRRQTLQPRTAKPSPAAQVNPGSRFAPPSPVRLYGQFGDNVVDSFIRPNTPPQPIIVGLDRFYERLASPNR